MAKKLINCIAEETNQQFISFSKQQQNRYTQKKKQEHTLTQLAFLFLERNDKDIHYYT